MRIVKAAIVVAIILALLPAAVACRQKQPAKSGGHMTEQEHSRVVFGNLLRNGFTGANPVFQGHVKMTAKLDGAEPVVSVVPALLGVVASTVRRFQFYSASGAPQWGYEKSGDVEVVLNGNRLYYQNTNYFLNCVTMGNKEIMRHLSLPGCVGIGSRLSLFAPSVDDFVVAVQVYGKGERPPQWEVNRSAFGSSISKWTVEDTGIVALRPLYDEKSLRAYVFTGEVRVISAGTEGAQTATFSLPLKSAQVWSATDDGKLLVLGSSEKGEALLCMDLSGKELWRFTLPPGEAWQPAQPPMVGANGAVLALSLNGVWCVKDGDLQWSYAEPACRFGCSLADGGLLLAAGQNLLRIGPDGKVLTTVDLDGAATAPPVVDKDGHAVVATESRLLWIE